MTIFLREIRDGGRERLRVYGRFAGQRFKDLPNIVGMLGGDYTPNKADQWTVTDLASAIREQDSSWTLGESRRFRSKNGGSGAEKSSRFDDLLASKGADEWIDDPCLVVSVYS
jgi:Uma2 family endonuclease